MAKALSVQVDLSDLLSAGVIIRAGIFANLSAAVRATVETGEERWRQAVQSAPLWSGEAQAYSASIKGVITGAFSGEISSNYKYVEDIESGRPAYDMKRMLDTSMKVRISKQGYRYLIIPFRHNTPGNSAHANAMPKAVYAQARQLAPSRVTGHGTRLSGTGAWDIKTKAPAEVRQRAYKWGDRLAAGTARKLQPHHKSDPYAGMVKMNTTTPGGKTSSSYLSFRVMSERSGGWIIPARPGLWIAKAVAESLQRTAEAEFPAAVQRDVA